MAKIVFVVSLFYVLLNSVRAWFAVVAGDHYAVNSYSNTTFLAGVVMFVSLYFIITPSNK